MSRFFAYHPDQGYVLPAYVQDVLGAEHLCFHVHQIVEALDVSQFEQAYGAEGRLAYPPRMMLKVWLYAFALGVTSTRRLEQRIREDLPLRYLAGCLQPDHKTLSEFLRRHRVAINGVFTQVLEMARAAGMAKLGHVAIDSSRIQANASRHKMVDREQAERDQRARDRRTVRRFQQKANAPEGDEGAGGVRRGDAGGRGGVPRAARRARGTVARAAGGGVRSQAARAGREDRAQDPRG